MKTYNEIRNEIARLEKDAKEAYQREFSAIIGEIKQKMADYGITASDLGAKVLKKKTVPAKYKNSATGELWSGRGKAPKWISGKNKNDFLI